jgi:hypothetical protein
MFSLRFAGAAASIRGSPKLARTVVHTHRRIGFAKRFLFIPTSFVMTNLLQRKGPSRRPNCTATSMFTGAPLCLLTIFDLTIFLWRSRLLPPFRI